MKKLVYFCLLVMIQPCYASEAESESEAFSPCACIARHRGGRTFDLLHDSRSVVAAAAAKVAADAAAAALGDVLKEAHADLAARAERHDEKPCAALEGAGMKRKADGISGYSGFEDHALGGAAKRFKPAFDKDFKGKREKIIASLSVVIKSPNGDEPVDQFARHGLELSLTNRALISGGFKRRLEADIDTLTELYRAKESKNPDDYARELQKLEKKVINALDYLSDQKIQALYLLYHGNVQQYGIDRCLCVKLWQQYENYARKELPSPAYQYISYLLKGRDWAWAPYFYTEQQILDIYMRENPDLEYFKTAVLPWVISDKPETFLCNAEAQLAGDGLRADYKKELKKICNLMNCDSIKMIHVINFGSSEKWKQRMERMKRLMFALGQEEEEIFFVSHEAREKRGKRIEGRETHPLTREFLAPEADLFARPVAAAAGGAGVITVVRGDLPAASAALRVATAAAAASSRVCELERLQ